jgi:hypothetical protein
MNKPAPYVKNIGIISTNIDSLSIKEIGKLNKKMDIVLIKDKNGEYNLIVGIRATSILSYSRGIYDIIWPLNQKRKEDIIIMIDMESGKLFYELGENARNSRNMYENSKDCFVEFSYFRKYQSKHNRSLSLDPDKDLNIIRKKGPFPI